MDRSSQSGRRNSTNTSACTPPSGRTCSKMIRQCNIRNYSIYLRQLPDGCHYLFSYFEYVRRRFCRRHGQDGSRPRDPTWWDSANRARRPCRPGAGRVVGHRWTRSSTRIDVARRFGACLRCRRAARMLDEATGSPDRRLPRMCFRRGREPRPSREIIAENHHERTLRTYPCLCHDVYCGACDVVPRG